MNITNESLGAVSSCRVGEEKYTTFRLTPQSRRGNKNIYFQYEYRCSVTGRLFTCVAPTLDKCRDKRDKWLATNN